ncbi:MAG: serine/threonine-protein kinase, partial [Myxococcota bacterium]
MSDERVLYEPGQVIADRYLVEEVVGRGTTGTVYRAENLTPDTIPERVAIKVVHPHLRQERQVLGRLRREARILARVESPYLCPLYEFIEDEHRIILVLEYVDGPALDAYIARRDGPLPLGEALEIGRQVCEALEAAHRAGVIHRDLKPANILVEGVADEEDEQTPPRSSFLRDLRVRVVDFGLAKDIEGDMTSSHTVLTEQDMVFGTPDYMAPEQVAGETIDARSDVYAAGILLYELVAGTRPFDHASPIATMRAHLQEAVLSPR